VHGPQGWHPCREPARKVVQLSDACRCCRRWQSRAVAPGQYAPTPAVTGLARWAALPDVPDLPPGEDRSFGSGLFVDLVPSSCWFTNVRSCVIPRDWERLRRMVTNRSGERCEACGQSADASTGTQLAY
jgi:hypothetical protein